jgi:CRP-like cAMP-binding protein
MSLENYLSVIKTDPKFIEFNKEEIKELFSYCELKDYKKGSDIITEGDIGDKLYIIADGEVGISKIVSNQVVFFITTLKKGDIFGEMAIISSYPRSANVFAKTDVKLVYLSKDAFELIRKDNPVIFGKISWILAKILAERLYKIEDRIKSILSTTLTQVIV